MAVVSVNEYFDRSGSQDSTKTDFSRMFNVICSDVRDGAAVIFSHNDIPTILSAYINTGNESWPSALLRSRTAKLMGGEGSQWQWRVECKYSTKGDGDEQEGQENPILQPTQISVRTNRYGKAVDKDRTTPNPKAICNSAGQPFDPPLEIDDSRPVLVLKKNVTFFSLAWLNEYKDATNSDPYLGFEKYFWKISDITADRTFWDAPSGQRFYYWEASMEIEGNDLLWWPTKVLDRGRNQRGPGNTLLPIRAGTDRRPVQDPVPLNGEGGAHPNLGDPDLVPFFREFDLYKRRSFGALGLL